MKKSVLAMLVLVLVLLQVRLWSGAGSMAEIARLEDRIAVQTVENSTLEGRNSALMEEVSDLRNGLDSIEERARNELGLIRQGETFYLIVAEEMDVAQADGEPLADLTQFSREAPVPVPEPPPEITEEANPYLDVFRDDEATAQPLRAADARDADTGQTAGQ